MAKTTENGQVHVGISISEDERSLWHKIKRFHGHETLAQMLSEAVLTQYGDTIRALLIPEETPDAPQEQQH